jgi:hypothetical protein
MYIYIFFSILKAFQIYLKIYYHNCQNSHYQRDSDMPTKLLNQRRNKYLLGVGHVWLGDN